MTSRRRRPRLALHAAAAVGTLAACGDARAPRWIPLAQSLALDPAPIERISHPPWRDGRSAELATRGTETRLRFELAPGDWEHVQAPDCWRSTFHLRLPSASLVVSIGAEPLARGSVADLVRGPKGRVFLYREDTLGLGGFGENPPESVTLSCELSGSSALGRVSSSSCAGEGIEIPTGSSASCVVDLPPRSALRFATHVETLFSPQDAEQESLFSVRLDGTTLFEEHVRWSEQPCTSWHAVPLPDEGRAGARLVFAVDGALASTAFLAPLIGPRDVGRPGRRPWADERADILVFVADTFRADNLGAYGSTLGLTPRLDELARDSLCFSRAWSTATWTLPAHATLFSGYYPTQVGTTDENLLVPQGVVTVAERLAQAGYRTAAVTDGGYVSWRYGLDQGFASFQEMPREVDAVLDAARACLDADDGRPLFLFVQTYRVHFPYRVSAETRAALGAHLGIQEDPETLRAAVFAEAREQAAAAGTEPLLLERLRSTPRLEGIVHDLRAHYLGAVVDFDQAFGGFLEHLRARGFFASGYLVFTSDHGEGFGEHGEVFHGGNPYDEKTRIPLFVAGRGLAPRRSDEPVSLLDLAPTLVEMAGLPAPDDWPGHSLLAPRVPERALLAFGARDHLPDSLCLLAQGRKVLFTLDRGEPRLIGAFDLARDAAEQHDEAGEGWPRRLLEERAALLRTALERVVEDETAQLGAEEHGELEALGY